MFKLFKKKRGKTMALNQEELEKLKGLSKEDKEILIKSLQEETVEETKVEETVETVEKEEKEEKPKEEPKEVEKSKVEEKPKEKQLEKEEKPKEEPKKEPETKNGGEKGNSWEEALKKLKQESDERIAKLEKELEEVKKRSPKGLTPTPTPLKNDLKDDTDKKNKYLQNRW